MSFIAMVSKYVKINVALQVLGLLMITAGFLLRAHWVSGPVFWFGLLLAVCGFLWSMLVNPQAAGA